MASTEFLLYLVTVALVVVLVMNWSNNNDSETESREMERQREHDRMMSKMKRQMEKAKDDSSHDGSRGSQGMPGQPGTQVGRNVRVNVNNRKGPGIGPGVPPLDPLRQHDYNAIYDDFTPPFRRSYYDDYALHPGLYPTYTRGPPGRFRKVGTLSAQGVSANDKFKFLTLMGRQKYNNREYEYFVTSPDRDSSIKFYIDTNELKIRDGDIVKVKELDGYTYKFREDEDLSPKYDPYFI